MKVLSKLRQQRHSSRDTTVTELSRASAYEVIGQDTTLLEPLEVLNRPLDCTLYGDPAAQRGLYRRWLSNLSTEIQQFSSLSVWADVALKRMQLACSKLVSPGGCPPPLLVLTSCAIMDVLSSELQIPVLKDLQKVISSALFLPTTFVSASHTEAGYLNKTFFL
eukprot:PhF_6_TR22561/c0_g1_i2/m.32098